MKKQGKQATRGQKQILEENKQTVAFYFNVVLLSNVTFLAANSIFFWSAFTAKFIILYVLTAAVSFGAFYFMKGMATPTLSSTGEVIDSGSDLNMEGHFSEYLKDIILFIAGVQILSLITSYAWILLVVIPIFAFYKLWVLVLAPWFFAPAPEDQGDAGKEDKKPKTRVQRVQRR